MYKKKILKRKAKPYVRKSYMPRSLQPSNMKTEVKRFPFNMELNATSIGLSFANPAHINGWNCIQGCVYGTGQGNRIGKKIFIRYFHIKYTVFAHSLGTFEPVRLVCVGDRKANPQQSPAKNTSPYIHDANRTPIDYYNNYMEWNNNVNTEDWIIYSDDIVSFNTCQWQ